MINAIVPVTGYQDEICNFYEGSSYQDTNVNLAQTLTGKTIQSFPVLANRRKRLAATVPMDFAAHSSSNLDIRLVYFRVGS